MMSASVFLFLYLLAGDRVASRLDRRAAGFFSRFYGARSLPAAALLWLTWPATLAWLSTVSRRHLPVARLTHIKPLPMARYRRGARLMRTVLGGVRFLSTREGRS